MRLIHKKDFFIAILIYLLALLISFSFRITYLWATIIIYLAPAIFIFSRIRHNRRNILLFTFVVGVLVGLLVELIAIPGHGWDVQQIIPFRIFGYGYWEDIVWSISYSFWVIVMYKHCVESDYTVHLNKRFKELFLLVVFSNAILFILGWLGRLPKLEYAYLWVGLIFVIPYLIFLSFTHWHLLIKGIPIFIFLSIAAFLYELTALSIGNYLFAGNYVYIFSIKSLTIPIEDIVFWMVLTAPVLIGIYEYFFEGH